MTNNDLIVTIGDLIDYLTETFKRDEKVLKSDLQSTGYNMFFKTEQTHFRVVCNPDPKQDCQFIDAELNKTYTEGQTTRVVVL